MYNIQYYKTYLGFRYYLPMVETRFNDKIVILNNIEKQFKYMTQNQQIRNIIYSDHY